MEATLQDVSEQLLAFNTQRQEPLQCFNCGKLGCVTRLCRGERAPPVTVTCFECGNRGHLVHNCRNQQQPRRHPNQASWVCTPIVMSAYTTQHIPAYTTGTINNHQTQLSLDSGTSRSVVSKKYINTDKISPKQSIQLINADGRSFTPLGTSPAIVTLGQYSANHTFLVDNLSVPVILGCDIMIFWET